MIQDRGEFRWSAKAEEAAELVAHDKLTDEEISAKVGISRPTLARWKRSVEFSARVQSYVDEFRRRVRRRGIAIIENRVAALDDRWKRMQRVIEERAKDEVMQDVAGGTTGLLCHTKKGVGAGPAAEVVDEFAVDTGLLKELREHEKQAAQELGQWVEKPEPGKADGGADEIDPALIAKIRRLLADDAQSPSHQRGDDPSSDPGPEAGDA